MYVADENSNNYKNVLKAASQLKSDCNWYVMSGPNAEPHRKDGEDVIYFRQPHVSIVYAIIHCIEYSYLWSVLLPNVAMLKMCVIYLHIFRHVVK